MYEDLVMWPFSSNNKNKLIYSEEDYTNMVNKFASNVLPYLNETRLREAIKDPTIQKDLRVALRKLLKLKRQSKTTQ